MNNILYYWFHFLRCWNFIDLLGAKQSGNWDMVSDCRLRIARLDEQLDRLGVQK